MDRFSSELPRLVFKRSIHEDTSNVSMDKDMLLILAEIDGKRNVEELSKDLDMTMTDLRGVLARLDDKGLISEVPQEVPTLSQEGLAALKKYLVQALGPMGEVLLEDVAEELGFDASSIPLNRASELIDSLAEELPDEASKRKFKSKLRQRMGLE